MDAGRLANRRFAAAMRCDKVDTEYEPQTHGTPITLVTDTVSRTTVTTRATEHAAFHKNGHRTEVHAAGETDAETRERTFVCRDARLGAETNVCLSMFGSPR